MEEYGPYVLCTRIEKDRLRWSILLSLIGKASCPDVVWDAMMLVKAKHINELTAQQAIDIRTMLEKD